MCLKTPMFTFVVPAYNVEKYLEQCLDSLVNQTEIDHKIIVINDGSTDGTAAICQKYEEEYPEMIRYVFQENQGLGAARNKGLSLVDTPYVTFLDSDDWQDCRFIEKLKKELKYHEKPVDIVFTLPWIVNAVTGRIEEWHDRKLLDQLFYPENCAEDVHSRVIHTGIPEGLQLYELEPSSCRRIYRTAFLQKIHFKFPVGVKWEDVLPHFYAIHHAKRCIAVRTTGFFYRVNTGAQITSSKGQSRLDMIPVFEETLRMAINGRWKDREIAYMIRMLWSFSAWSIGVTNTKYLDELLVRLHGLLKSIPMRYIKVYKNTCLVCRKDLLLLYFMRSPFYKLLKDYQVRESVQAILLKTWRYRNMFRRKPV